MKDSQPARILALWSAPRSRSTAFLRMMVERGDFTVLHEPFSHVVDFGTTSVEGATVTTEAELIAAINVLAQTRPVFFKDTTDFHYPGLLANDEFLRSATHTFIIRDPAAVIASHYALTPNLRCADVGIERLAEIYDAVASRTGTAPVVIAAEDLVHAPEATLRAYFAAVGIRYVADALTWQPRMLGEWQKTGRWHVSTSRSSGFANTSCSYVDTVESNATLAGYYAHHVPYYQKLLRNRLLVPGDAG